MLYKLATALLIALTAAPSIALEALDDAALTDVAGQAAGADFDNISLTANNLNMRLLVKHANTANNFSFVISNLNGNLTISKIGLDGARVGGNPAMRFTFGTATLTGSGPTAVVSSTTESQFYFGSPGNAPLTIAGFTTAPDIDANFSGTPSNNPLFGLHMFGAIGVFGAVKVFSCLPAAGNNC